MVGYKGRTLPRRLLHSSTQAPPSPSLPAGCALRCEHRVMALPGDWCSLGGKCDTMCARSMAACCTVTGRASLSLTVSCAALYVRFAEDKVSMASQPLRRWSVPRAVCYPHRRSRTAWRRPMQPTSSSTSLSWALQVRAAPLLAWKDGSHLFAVMHTSRIRHCRVNHVVCKPKPSVPQNHWPDGARLATGPRYAITYVQECPHRSYASQPLPLHTLQETLMARWAARQTREGA